MPTTDNNQYVEEIETSNFSLDVKKLIADALHYWWVFPIAVLLAIAAVKIYHRYKTPIFASQLTLLIDEQERSSSGFGTVSEQSLMTGFMLSPGMLNLNNQVAILNSYSLVRSAVEQLGDCISYYHPGTIRNIEIYNPQDYRIVIDSTHLQLVNTKLMIDSVDAEHFHLTVKAERATVYDYLKNKGVNTIENLDYEGTFRYGEPIVTDWCAFALLKKDDAPKNMYVVFNTLEQIIARYRGGYSVNYDEKSSSTVVTLQFVGPNLARNNDFLNAIANSFIASNLSQKNQIAENTIKFIGEQLNYLSDTLTTIGTQLSSFRATHDLQQPVTTKGTSLFQELQNYENEYEAEQVKKSYYVYLEKYFTSDSLFTGVIAPAVFDTKSTSIAQQLQGIIQLNTERQSYQDTYGMTTTPAYREVMSRLQIARNTLLHSVASHKAMCDDNLADINVKIEACRRELQRLPETERTLLGIDRKYSLNNDVFTFLLRKRSEAEIQKASNMSDHKVIDYAMYSGTISTSESKHRMIAILLALAGPICLLIIRQFFDNKIRTLDDLKKISELPVLGNILSNNKDSAKVVLNHPKSVQSEVFRMLRTKIEFLITQKQVPVIALTSSVSGEGKTFCSLNLASAFSITGKRTILLGFDLRKPGLSKLIKAEHNVGLSDYIIGHSDYDSVIIHLAQNFDCIPGGTIPPNPSELIGSEKTRELFKYLKQNYDIIFVDTPPMGVVSDAQQILTYSDALLFIVRQDYTERIALRTTLEGFAETGFKNAALVLNDVNSRKARYITNGYGYGYTHRYGLRRSNKHGDNKYYGNYYGSDSYYTED